LAYWPVGHVIEQMLVLSAKKYGVVAAVPQEVQLLSPAATQVAQPAVHCWQVPLMVGSVLIDAK